MNTAQFIMIAFIMIISVIQVVVGAVVARDDQRSLILMLTGIYLLVMVIVLVAASILKTISAVG